MHTLPPSILDNATNLRGILEIPWPDILNPRRYVLLSSDPTAQIYLTLAAAQTALASLSPPNIPEIHR